MADPFGFMKYTRIDNPMRPIYQRVKDFEELEDTLSDEERRKQAARCMNCGVPHCHSGFFYGGGRAVGGCPNDNLIPEWNDLIYRSEDKRAFERLTLTNYMPDFTGHVCPAPCEISCNEALHNKGITIRNNERFIIDQGFKYGWVEASGRPTKRNDIEVAVVGSGPAGLAAAWRLNQLGYRVTVFERDDRPGGLVMYGIPNMKLPKEDVARRIAVMEKVGIKFQVNTTVGVDVTADELKQRFARVILAIGARQARDLQAPGRDLNGVYQAVDFLTKATKAVIAEGTAANQKLAGKKVVVIGGGDTGNDCIATAVRLGAADVRQLEITPAAPTERPDNNPWPEWPRIRKSGYGQAEAQELFGGVLTQYETTAVGFKGAAGQLQTLVTSKVDHFKPVAGTEQEVPADLVLLAMGFTGADTSVFDAFGVHEVYDDYRTDNDQVYVAGDARRGPSLVIWGIREGRKAAEAVNQSLQALATVQAE
jgi:glutamate synthase (NADPH/NADH) small chain